MHYSCSTTVLLKPLTFGLECLSPFTSRLLPHLPCLLPFAYALSRAHYRGVLYRDGTGMGQGWDRAFGGQGCAARLTGGWKRGRCTWEKKLTCVRFAAELRPRRPAIPLPAEATEATEHACLARQHVRQFVPACGLVLEEETGCHTRRKRS
jgi:hypothetical protein